ncbi:thermonuclease family protein [Phormidium sp. LEGE 05292]|uniref:thermonuclease family protein n=1 Tax=[Phormidium] sp. LEGE 05292 TaxID=767427 RepID=UPI001881F032|nr:thermonuclease family protein [Phormidium sp. LEGE 05292]MBE9224039.1 thermonuclease family protein [Phormidium sp. LEGE 05292]
MSGISFLQGTLLFSLLLLASCNADRLPNQRMFLESIASGNEIEMTSQGQTYRVRLCGVDVPAKQDGQARKLLKKLTDLTDEEAKGLVVVTVRSDGNTIRAEVYAPTTNQDEETSLNAELLAAGLARTTGESCPNRETFQSIEQDAKEQRLGLWGHQ